MSISVNLKIIICYCPKECSALHWWAKQNDVYNKRWQHVYTFQKNNRVRHRVPYYFYRVIPAPSSKLLPSSHAVRLRDGGFLLAFLRKQVACALRGMNIFCLILIPLPSRATLE